MPTLTLQLTDAIAPAAEALIRAAGYRHAREGNVEALRRLCAHPQAPEDFLLAVCHLPECQDVLGHRPLPPRVLEVLAEMYQYPEAIITLGKQLYEDPETSITRFRSYLEGHTENGWLYRSLAHERASQAEKEQVLLDVSANTEWGETVRQIMELRLRVAEAEKAADDSKLRQLFQSNEPAVLLALASNPHTPGEILQQLATVSRVKFARQIRNAAQEQLSTSVSLRE